MGRAFVFVLAACQLSTPAFAQCQLCAPSAGPQPIVRAVPLGIRIEAALDLGRAAQTRAGGGGMITLDARTGARRVSGSLADLGGMSLRGTVRLAGDPLAPVVVSVPARIALTAPNGSTADVVDIRTDLPANAILDARGQLSFAFAGRLIVTGGVSGDFRGRIAITAEYR